MELQPITVSVTNTKHAHARYAALKRWRKPGHPELAAAAKDLEAAKLADHIQKVVDGWPELTPEQKARIAILLRPPRRRS